MRDDDNEIVVPSAFLGPLDMHEVDVFFFFFFSVGLHFLTITATVS
jgi:hypothetical protein